VSRSSPASTRQARAPWPDRLPSVLMRTAARHVRYNDRSPRTHHSGACSTSTGCSTTAPYFDCFVIKKLGPSNGRSTVQSPRHGGGGGGGGGGSQRGPVAYCAIPPAPIPEPRKIVVKRRLSRVRCAIPSTLDHEFCRGFIGVIGGCQDEQIWNQAR